MHRDVSMLDILSDEYYRGDMNKFDIRQARKIDASRIRVLLIQLGYKTSISKIEVMISKTVKSDDDIYVAIQDEEVVAVISLMYFTFFYSAEKLCRITTIVVDENKRGSGIGTALVGFAKTQAQAKNCKIIELTTDMLRKETDTFYNDNGFRKTSFKYEQEL